MNGASDVSRQAIEAHLADLNAAARTWAALTPGQILPYLEQARTDTLAVAEAWVGAACEAKGLDPDSPLRGEEWVSGPWALLAGLNGLLHTLGALATGKDPLAGFPVADKPGGQVAVRVFPGNPWDALLLNGVTAWVWQQPGVTRANLADHVASRFSGTTEPAVSLILGAGNINSIPPLDALYKLVAEGQVCLVKLNPVNDYLEEPLTRAFQGLVDAGFVRFVRGDGAIGAWLATHPLVDAMHITGSGRTHDVIVFGAGEEGAARKAAGTQVNPRPITSELGGVGPTVVLPGRWSPSDIRFQAEHLVTQKLHNGGFNCIASQVLVLPADWDQADALLDAVRDVLREVVDNRPAYYPHTDDRLQVFRDAHPDAERFGARSPFLLIDDVDLAGHDVCLQTEAFGPMWAVVRLPSPTVEAFLDQAVTLANDRITGTLGCQLVVDPATAKAHRTALDQAIAKLRYGTIGVNAWSGVGFLLPFAHWGAFPGHTLADVQSGLGVVHNALLFDASQKTVVHAPFRPFPRALLGGELHISPKPLWFVTHKQAATVGRLVTRFEATRNVALVPPLFAAALAG